MTRAGAAFGVTAGVHRRPAGGEWRCRTCGFADVVDPDALANLSYVVVDLETTGSQHYAGDRITEVAAVVVRGGNIVEVFETLVNPERPIPSFVSRLTNITWEMVKNAPRFADIEPHVVGVSRVTCSLRTTRISIGDSSQPRCAEHRGARLVGRRMCTVRLARQFLPPGLPRRSLDHLGASLRGRDQWPPPGGRRRSRNSASV